MAAGAVFPARHDALPPTTTHERRRSLFIPLCFRLAAFYTAAYLRWPPGRRLPPPPGRKNTAVRRRRQVGPTARDSSRTGASGATEPDRASAARGSVSSEVGPSWDRSSTSAGGVRMGRAASSPLELVPSPRPSARHEARTGWSQWSDVTGRWRRCVWLRARLRARAAGSDPGLGCGPVRAGRPAGYGGCALQPPPAASAAAGGSHCAAAASECRQLGRHDLAPDVTVCGRAHRWRAGAARLSCRRWTAGPVRRHRRDRHRTAGPVRRHRRDRHRTAAVTDTGRPVTAPLRPTQGGRSGPTAPPRPTQGGRRESAGRPAGVGRKAGGCRVRHRLTDRKRPTRADQRHTKADFSRPQLKQLDCSWGGLTPGLQMKEHENTAKFSTNVHGATEDTPKQILLYSEEDNYFNTQHSTAMSILSCNHYIDKKCTYVI